MTTFFKSYNKYKQNIKEIFQQPWLYDEKSDMEKVMETLNDLMEKLMTFSARDKQIREWQKIFKVGKYCIILMYCDITSKL